MSIMHDKLNRFVIYMLAALVFAGCSNAKDESAPTSPHQVSGKTRAERLKTEEPASAEPAATTAAKAADVAEEPSAAKPIAVQPKAAKPKFVRPKMAKPKAAKPQLSPPKAASPKAAQPKPAEPKAARPGETKPKRFLYRPKIAPKAVGSPRLEPAAAEPMAAAPAMDDEPGDEQIDAKVAEGDTKTGYDIVEIFYATDRQAEIVYPWTWLGAISWGYMAVTAAVIGVLLLIARLISKSRTATVLGLIFLLAAGGLVICSFLIPRTTKPRDRQYSRNYGKQRGEMEYGTCKVSIPEAHVVGEIERPNVFRFEFNEDPNRHVVLLSIDHEQPQQFFNQLEKEVSKSPERQTFVFVHGYNVTFEGAARRTAQLKYDLEFDGPAICYSWPSQGALLQYTVDETNVVWTIVHLEEFLAAVAERTGARQIHLIAHSMGNRALTAALERMSRNLRPGDSPAFNELVLTAPDIDAEVFRRDIVPAIVKTARRVTLYASSNDGALAISKTFHGYPRAGESGENMVIVPGVDTIDVSGIDTSLLGHTYYGDNDTVLTDIVQLLRESKPPSLRARLRAAVRNGLQYWEFLSNDNHQP